VHKELRYKLKAQYGSAPSATQIRAFASSIGYLCRMYWQHRTDKLHKDDYILYRALTNAFCPVEDSDKLSSGYLPKYGNTPLFIGKYDCTKFEHHVVSSVETLLLPEPKSKSLSFLNRLKQFMSELLG
jgi:hypothetical protein